MRWQEKIEIGNWEMILGYWKLKGRPVPMIRSGAVCVLSLLFFQKRLILQAKITRHMTPVLEKTMTWREFREMEIPEGEELLIFELINGMIVKRGAPSLKHQNAVGVFYARFQTFVSEKKLGKAFTSPLDVFFDDGNGFQPDICYISNERSFLLDNGEYVNGAPDLVVEVLSPGTSKNDRVEKKSVYEKYAVKEYWLIDPIYRTVEIFVMKDNLLQLSAIQENTGKVESALLPGFELMIESLFD
jgi:Uma2 family endonuclease